VLRKILVKVILRNRVFFRFSGSGSGFKPGTGKGLNYNIFEKSFKNPEFFERKLDLKTIGCININKNSREKSNLLFGISKT